MKKQAHVHCWHVKSSTTDGMGVEGFDSQICCFCGLTRRQKWKYVKDPAHGNYVDASIREWVGGDVKP